MLASSLSNICDLSGKNAQIALSGSSTIYWNENLAATLAAYIGTPTHVLVNLGVNDTGTNEATFKTNFANILDQFHAKWPSALVGVAHVWKRNYDMACANMNTWIDTVLSTRLAWTFQGPDETVWLKGSDDGATMTFDGIHYSAEGHTENFIQWKAAMGY
jgi:lysophospholipase L1-like esterase